ncbi:WD40 domain-containing protein [Micromonospora narathiwatensis]
MGHAPAGRRRKRHVKTELPRARGPVPAAPTSTCSANASFHRADMPSQDQRQTPFGRTRLGTLAGTSTDRRPPTPRAAARKAPTNMCSTLSLKTSSQRCSPAANVLAVALRDGSVHLAGVDGNVRLDGEAESLAWSPDGSRLAAGCKDNTVWVWHIRTRSSAGVLRGHADWVGALAWSPSGRYLASGSDDRTVRIWDIEHPGDSTVHSGHRTTWTDSAGHRTNGGSRPAPPTGTSASGTSPALTGRGC